MPAISLSCPFARNKLHQPFYVCGRNSFEETQSVAIIVWGGRRRLWQRRRRLFHRTPSVCLRKFTHRLKRMCVCVPALHKHMCVCVCVEYITVRSWVAIIFLQRQQQCCCDKTFRKGHPAHLYYLCAAPSVGCSGYKVNALRVKTSLIICCRRSCVPSLRHSSKPLGLKNTEHLRRFRLFIFYTTSSTPILPLQGLSRCACLCQHSSVHARTYTQPVASIDTCVKLIMYVLAFEICQFKLPRVFCAFANKLSPRVKYRSCFASAKCRPSIFWACTSAPIRVYYSVSVI